MDDYFKKKLRPADQSWIIINNLDYFNDKPNLIKDIFDKLKDIPEHPIMAMFLDIYDELWTYYESKNKFPDMKWVNASLSSKDIKFTSDEFSMSIYEDFISFLDLECLKAETRRTLMENPNVSPAELRVLSSKMSKYSDSKVEIPEITKEKILHMYEEYDKEYNGIQTHVKQLDDAIGVLGYKSISAFVAPSGHGKSTFATSVSYNTAVIDGNCVDYLSFEVPYQQIWFNLTSMESSYLYSKGQESLRLPASEIKERRLTEDQARRQVACAESIMNKLNKSGGYINVVDQTQTQVSSFEGLCAKLESIAEERGRKADLIVIDNVDNLQILQSSERDEATRVNNYIIKLDSFCKNYFNGEGTHILLLSQVNRPALKKLQSTEGDSKKKSVIDVSCIQKFNAIYEKATCVLVGFANESMRFHKNMNIFPVKLRNRAVPEKPINVPIDFKYSRFGGEDIDRFIPKSNDRSILVGSANVTNKNDLIKASNEPIQPDDIELEEEDVSMEDMLGSNG